VPPRPATRPLLTVPSVSLSSVLAFLTMLGTVWIAVRQGDSANRVAELKAASEKQEAQTTENSRTLKVVHDLTNTNFSEQKAQLAAQASEMREMRATITRLETMLSEKAKTEKR